MPAQLLSASDLASLSTTLPNWQLVAGQLHRDLVFADFVEVSSNILKLNQMISLRLVYLENRG